MTSFRYYLPTLLWAALLFYLSSFTANDLPNLNIEFSDLVVHFIVYSVLGYFLGIAFFAPEMKMSQQKIFIAILIGMLYGASDEIHQMYVPGRMATVSDWVADSLGVMFGLSVFIKFPAIFKFINAKVFRQV